MHTHANARAHRNRAWKHAMHDEVFCLADVITGDYYWHWDEEGETGSCDLGRKATVISFAPRRGGV